MFDGFALLIISNGTTRTARLLMQYKNRNPYNYKVLAPVLGGVLRLLDLNEIGEELWNK
jgi:hypothetical protein